VKKLMRQFNLKCFFSFIAIGGLLASGIYFGIMNVEGVTVINSIKAVVFCILGLLMFWGALTN